MELLKEDGTARLSNEAAQAYINELEAQVKLLGRSKANVVDRLDEYQGEQGPYLLFKDMLLRALDDYNVMDDIGYRVTNLEDEKLSDYDIIDTVVDSSRFESIVDNMIENKLSEVKFKVTIEE